MAVSISISIAQNSQGVANNQSNVTVKVTAKWTYGSYNRNDPAGWCKIDGTKYAFTSDFNASQTTSGSQVIFSKTLNITHGSDGTKTLDVSASFTTGVSSGTVTASASKVLTTIPRKSSLSASNGTLGTAQTLTVTRQASSFTHTITYKCGSASGTICTKSSDTSISWTPPLSLAQQNTTGTSVSITLTITTYSGSTSVGSNTKTITCTIPASVAPTVSIALSDPTGHSSKYGYYVQGQSKIKIVVTASGSQGSTIKTYSTTADGNTYTAATVTTEAISGSGTLTIKTTVKDSRGRTATASKTISVWGYSHPKISAITATRCNADGSQNSSGNYITVKFSTVSSSVDSANSIAYAVQYKKASETAYTTANLTNYAGQHSLSNAVFVFPADTNSSYDITLTVTDDFGSVAKTAVGPSVKKLWSWLSKGLGIAFGKIAELENVMDIGFLTRFTGGILHPVLKPETDLDDIRTPNTYVGANLASNNYANCPLDSGTFTLEVVGMGESGQVKQRVTSCNKTGARAFERIFYSNSWGEWVCVSDYAGTLLWSGELWMTAAHTVTLSEPVSKQPSGIVLVFSLYDSEVKNQEMFEFFVPKYTISAHSGSGRNFNLCGMFRNGVKYLYLHDGKITGNDKNSATMTIGGITYDNSKYVLRYVIGV